MFVQVSQPLRVGANSLDYGGGKAPTQLDVAPLWVRAYEECIKWQNDPTILVDQNYDVFAGINNAVSESIKRYRMSTRTAPMMGTLFLGTNSLYSSTYTCLGFDLLVNDDLLSETLLVLKADAAAMALRLTTDKGGCKEFLPGGKFEAWRTDARLREAMANTKATTDDVESHFGVLDDIFASNNNLSLHSGGALSTWRTNHTKEWMESMESICPQFIEKTLSLSIPDGLRSKNESDSREAKAKKEQLNRMEEAAAKTIESEKRRIHQLLDLEGHGVVKTKCEMRSLLDPLTPANKTKEISRQVSSV